MNKQYTLEVIAHIHNDFHEKFGIPRQSGLADVESYIVFEKSYSMPEAFRGLEDYSHLWLIWQFSECADAGFRPTVRPPRLGGNKRMGVFATRSPYRPNSLGLSSVKLEKVLQTEEHGTVLVVTGADLMDGTPIFDIKPYLAYVDSHPEAKSGFAEDFVNYALTVECPPSLLDIVPKEKQAPLLQVLAGDPRPAYQHDEERIYKMTYGYYTVHFKVKDQTLTVTAIE
ncbi:MAG: tRNA (N6-threonylcarbamoyladenosine(37)-N6)-methyltransferase TrmO [Clostridia bacterium]|nr:tRNA (N6-threonylcarbamoyladenosine(37)-N6)-methyltransferase TrmO [Clostridia bacterium]